MCCKIFRKVFYTGDHCRTSFFAVARTRLQKLKKYNHTDERTTTADSGYFSNCIKSDFGTSFQGIFFKGQKLV